MKKIIAMLLAVMMVMSLMAVTAAADDVKEITLKVWTPADDQGTEDAWLQQMEAKFEADHPEYKITWINEVCGEDVARDTVTKDPAAAADVYMFANDQLGTLIAAEAIAKLGGSYLEQVLADNGDTMVASVTSPDGGVYGFPNAANTWFCYYNKDVYTEEDVKSLETMLEKGKVALQFTGGWYNGTFLFANGAEAYGPQGNDFEAGINFGPDGGVAAGEYMIALAQNPNFVLDADGKGKSQMMSGEIAAYFSGSWEYGDLFSALGDKLGACQLPTAMIGGEAKAMKSFAGSKAIAVNKQTKEMKASMQFAAFLASVEGQLLRYEVRKAVPVATVLAEDPAIAQDIVAVAILNTVANTSVLQPTQGMDNWWGNMETLGKSILSGETTVDNIADALAQTLDLINDGAL